MARHPRDWTKWRIAYAHGKSLKQIAIDSGIGYAIVEQKARSNGWTRTPDETQHALEKRLVKHILTPEIQAKYEMVNELTVEAIAAVRTALILDHKGGIEALRCGVEDMTAELLAANKPPTTVDARGRPHRDSNVDSLNRLSTRADILKKLSEAYKVLVGMERQAHGISDNANGDADKPKEPELSANDYARRLAYVLEQASRSQPAIEGERVED